LCGRVAVCHAVEFDTLASGERCPAGCRRRGLDRDDAAGFATGNPGDLAISRKGSAENQRLVDVAEAVGADQPAMMRDARTAEGPREKPGRVPCK
jgi:hypothetical protein